MDIEVRDKLFIENTGGQMPKVEYPAFAGHPEFKGCFVGGCVERGDGSSFRARAHAHYLTWKGVPNEKSGGWICVRSAKRLFKPDGSPSNLMLHELAHILTNQGHTDKFREKLKELGGRATLNAAKRKRRVLAGA